MRWLAIISGLLGMLSACTGKRELHDEIPKNEALENDAPAGEVSRGEAMSTATFEAFLFIEWGTKPEQLRPAYSEEVMGGLQVSAPTRKRFRPVMMRMDPVGGFHFLDSASQVIARYTAGGEFAGRTSLPWANGIEVIDYAANRTGYYILLGHTGQSIRLAALDHTGAEVWTRKAIDKEVAKPERVVLGHNALFIAGAADIGKLVELSLKDGGTTALHQLGQGAIRLFAAPEGALVSTTYFSKERRRGVVVYDPAMRRETSEIAGKELFGPLLSVFGTDAAHNVHVYGAALGSSSPAIYAVSPGGEIVHAEPVDSILVERRRNVLVLHKDKHQLRLRTFGDDTMDVTIPLPASLKAHAPDHMVFVGSDGDSLLFDLRGSSGQIEKRVALGLSTGVVEEVPVAAGAVVPGQQSAKFWQAAPDGSVYVPVATADGLAVVRAHW